MGKRKYYSGLFVVLLLASAAFTQNVRAQDSIKNLGLDEAIAAAINNSKTIRLAVLDEKGAAIRFKQTEALFLPQAAASYTAMSTNDPLNAFGFKLQQRSISAADFNPEVLKHPSATPSFNTKIEMQMPLLNMDMLYQRKGAQRQTEVYQYKTRRTKEYLTFEIQKAYLQLQLGYQAVDVLVDALNTAKSVYTYTSNHYQQGLIQRSDVLNAQVQVANVTANLARAQSNIRNSSDYISVLMGAKPVVIYRLTDAFNDSPALADTTRNLTPARADFMATQKAIEATGLMIKSSQLSYLPKLNAFGTYQNSSTSFAGFGANAYLVGVQLSWDIFKGNRTKNTIALQKLERDKLGEQLAQQQEQGQIELNKARRDMADAQLEILQQNAAVEQAAESLRILQNRYQQGLVNTSDVLMAQNQLAQQRLLLAQARFTSNVTRAYLQFLSVTSN